MPAVSRLEQTIRRELENAGQSTAHVVLVVDDEHCLERAAVRGDITSNLGRRHVGFYGSRQVHREHAALARRALHADPAAGLAHDTVAHGEAEARALAYVLGGEKRFEDLRTH